MYCSSCIFSDHGEYCLVMPVNLEEVIPVYFCSISLLLVGQWLWLVLQLSQLLFSLSDPMPVVGDAHFCLWITSLFHLHLFELVLTAGSGFLGSTQKKVEVDVWNPLQASTKLFGWACAVQELGRQQNILLAAGRQPWPASSFLYNNESFILKKLLLQEPLNTRKKKTNKEINLTAQLIWLILSLLKMSIKFVELGWNKHKKGTILIWLLCRVNRQQKHTKSARKAY